MGKENGLDLTAHFFRSRSLTPELQRTKVLKKNNCKILKNSC